jgi:hypothetical protein
MLATLLLTEGVASAQGKRFLGEVTRRPRTDTITEVIYRAGCNWLWYSKVMADSGLEGRAPELTQPGQKLYFAGRSCRTRPPAEVREKSLALLVGDLPEPVTADASIVAKIEPAKTPMEPQKAEIITREQEEVRFGYASLGSGGLIGLCLGLLAGHFFMRPRAKEGMIYCADIERIRHEGEEYVYEFVTVERVNGKVVGSFYRHVGCDSRDKNDLIKPKNFPGHAQSHFLRKKPEVVIKKQPQTA